MKASFFVLISFVILSITSSLGFAQDRRGVQDTVERGGWLISYGAELRGREAEAGEVAPGISLYNREAARDWARHLVDEAVRQAEDRYGSSALYSFGHSEQRDARRMLLETVGNLLRSRSAGESRMERGSVTFKAGVMSYIDPYRGRERFVPYAGIKMRRDFDHRPSYHDYGRGHDRHPSRPPYESEY